MKPLLVSLVLISVCCSGYRSESYLLDVPTTEREMGLEASNGDVVAHYRWLEGDEDDASRGARSAKVTRWVTAQNLYARKLLDGLPDDRELETALRNLSDIGSVATPIIRGNTFFYAHRSPGDDQPVIYQREGSLGVEKVLIDPAQLGNGGPPLGVSWFSPSQTGRLVAYGTYRVGDQFPLLHVIEAGSRREFPLQIENALPGVQWLPDDSGFLYGRVAHVNGGLIREGLLHRLGTSPETDTRVYAGCDRAELSATGDWLLLTCTLEPGKNQVWLVNFKNFRGSGELAVEKLSELGGGHVRATIVGDSIVLQTTQGAPNGRVVATKLTDRRHQWREIISERSDMAIQSMAFGKAVIAVTYLRDGFNGVEVFDFEGVSLGELRQPAIGTLTLTASTDQVEAFFVFSSFCYPPTVFRSNLRTPSMRPLQWMSSYRGSEQSSVKTERVYYASATGERRSMLLVRKDATVDQTATPTLLVAAGNPGQPLPEFVPLFVLWVQAGGLLAVPDLPSEPHERATADLVAASEWLIARQYTDTDKLGLYGSSTGGLLSATALMRRSDLFSVGVLRDADLGSTYRDIRSGHAYPAVLLTSDEAGDAAAGYARVVTAALQAATTSDPKTHPILLLTRRSGGTTPAEVEESELKQVTDLLRFLKVQLKLQ